jgi:hypothetical protein
MHLVPGTPLNRRIWLNLKKIKESSQNSTVEDFFNIIRGNRCHYDLDWMGDRLGTPRAVGISFGA